MHRRLLAGVISLVMLAGGVSAEEPATPRATNCADAVVAKVQCSNPEEVCRLLLPGRDPHQSIDLDSTFEFRVQDLGDGTKGYVFSHRPGKDAYVVMPNFHFALAGDSLVPYFDGHGVLATYLLDRPKVNGRFQIERTTHADIPGIYVKRDAERWFWTGKEYAKAFTRLTIEKAKDPKLNGVTTTWDPSAEAVYKDARNTRGGGGSWTQAVAAGDTLGAIAEKHGVSVDEIMRQNDIRSAGSLRLGQQIHFDAWKLNSR